MVGQKVKVIRNERPCVWGYREAMTVTLTEGEEWDLADETEHSYVLTRGPVAFTCRKTKFSKYFSLL